MLGFCMGVMVLLVGPLSFSHRTRLWLAMLFLLLALAAINLAPDNPYFSIPPRLAGGRVSHLFSFSAILRALSERLGATLPYDSLNQLRAKLFADHPSFGQIDYVAAGQPMDLARIGQAGDLDAAAFAGPATDFYLTNPIARASVTMAECSATAKAARIKTQAAE